MRVGRSAVLIVGVVLTGGCSDDSTPRGDSVITVPPGATLAEVTDTLSARGIVGSPRLFKAYARFREADRNIKAGNYTLREDAGWAEILDDLTTGRVMTVAVTFPEGLTLRQMAPHIVEVTGEPPEIVEQALLSPDAAESRHLPGPGLEGYLFPDTYRFAPGVSVGTVIDAMVDRYRTVWTPERTARARALSLERADITTLASIIQAEARHISEMPRISAVYHNRLRIGLPLQADPTVLYALGGHRERLLFAAMDSVANHPYNTYAVVGLPPGPIGAPGEQAIDAALNPEATDFLYFVARPNGTHIFTRSLTEHNQARAQARAEWDRQEREGAGAGRPTSSDGEDGGN